MDTTEKKDESNKESAGEYKKLLDSLLNALMKSQDILEKNIDTNILKSLAFIESLIDGVIIASLYGDPKKIIDPPVIAVELLDTLHISRKLRILKKFNLIDKKTAQKIDEINEIRVSHAHVKADIDTKKLESFTLRDIQLSLAQTFIKQVDPKALSWAIIQDELKQAKINYNRGK